MTDVTHEDMLPPPPGLGGSWPAGPVEPYSQPRGTCPSCGSAEVAHLIIGMPAGPEDGAGDPDWVWWVGCMHPGYTRKCQSCEATWTAEPVFADLASLMIEADVDELEGLCGWLSADYELDAWVITDEDQPDYFEVGFADRGVVIEFPISQQEFWSTLDELHSEVEADMERDEDV